MANNNNGGAMNFTTDQMDALFGQTTSCFDKGVKMVGQIAQTIDTAFGSDSRRNVGYPYMGTEFGYGASTMGAPMQQQPVQYGYGYANTNPYGNYGGMTMNVGSMFNDNPNDGFFNPAYGKAGY